MHAQSYEMGNPNNDQRKQNPLDEFFRRLIDIAASLFGLIFLAPVFLVISIAIRRSSPGPVFYWGPRAGKNGKTFRILKFRTMYERKESYEGPKVTAEDDPRITPLGHVLRQTKLNELPQLWNVLVGEMSLVGPRPEDPAITERWPEDVRREILSVKPGITSPASVVYRNEEDLLQSSNFMDTYLWDILPSKLRLDQIYVRNRSILTDLDVIFWTMVALLPRLKSISVPEHQLYWGPFSRFVTHYMGWFFIDFFVAFMTVATAAVIRRITTPLDLGLEVALGISLAIALLFSLINTLTGLNRIHWSKARAQDAVDLAFSTGIVTALVMVANLVFPRGTRFPMSVILISGVLSYIGFITVRYRSRLLTGLARYWMRLRGQSMTPLGERVLIVGAGEVARFSVWLLSNENLSRAFTILGMVDDNPRMVGTEVEGYPVISTTSFIPDLVKKHDIGLILFAISDIQPEEQDRILALCQMTSARVIPIPDIIDNLRAQFPMNEDEREIHFNKVIHNATIDRLTGAYNMPHFRRLAEVEFNRSRRYGHPLSMVAVWVDYVRPQKASYARSMASQALQAAARRCLENIRGIDLLGRYADDMLVILLPETNQTSAELVAERIKQRILHHPANTKRGLVQLNAEVAVVNNEPAAFDDFEAMLNSVIEPLRPIQRAHEVATISNANYK